MKRVLFLAYHFPPIGGGGVQRNAKFVRYLPEFGYEPLVVTGPGDAVSRWTPLDPSLLDEIPRGTQIWRVPSSEGRSFRGDMRRSDRLLMRPSPAHRHWRDEAINLTRRIGTQFDLIYASLIPYETAEAAATLSADLGIPWVADLQDPWVLDEMWIYPSAAHRRRDLSRMTRLLRTAAAVVMNTPEAALRVRRTLTPSPPPEIVSVPNGFDAADFAEPPPTRNDNAFRIVHSGYLHTELGLSLRRTAWLRRLLGGAAAEVDILTRSHLYLLEAVERLVEGDPQLNSAIEVHLAGVLTSSDHAIASRSPFVRYHGYVPHRDAISLVRSADLLFLPMHNLPASTRAGLVPGKTYEYLASGRPILAAIPDSDARDLLREAGNAVFCRPDDSERMAKLIAEQIRRWRADESSPPPAPSVLARFERRRLTSEVASVFDGVVSGVPRELLRASESWD